MAEFSPLIKYSLLMAGLWNCSGGPVDGHDDYEDAIDPPLPDALEPIDQHVKDTYADKPIEPPDTVSQDDGICSADGICGADTFPDTFDTEYTPFDTFIDTIDGMCEISGTCAPLDTLDTYDAIDTPFDADVIDAVADDGILVIPELPMPPPDIIQPQPDTIQPLPDTTPPPPDTNQSQPDTIQPPPEDTATAVDASEDGSIHCSPKDLTCDGIDDDCDGVADDDYESPSITCGNGACIAQGAWVCVGGVPEKTCTPGTPMAEVCDDGKDNDCDKATDEGCECKSADYEPISTTCGKGECASTGVTSCESGKVKDSCKSKTVPSPNDTSCDGKDNNCDGSTDEGYEPYIISCGTGLCENTIFTSCIDGDEDDVCTPKTPTTDICDGKDNDCDNLTDEGLGLGTSCTVGDGECQNSGVIVCNDTGGTKCSVLPKQPAPNDKTCDNKDDDCDKLADEGYEPYIISCGTGPCANTITTACTNGIEDNLCTPKAGSPDDTTCDGIDDDCDGVADDSYKPYQITCGTGPCANTITTSCTNGDEDNACTPGTPTSEICDGNDNDCDGKTDEALPDNDTDGLCNEIDDDVDGDAVVNWLDNCIEKINPEQLDKDADGLGDACDCMIDNMTALAINCYSDPSKSSKLSPAECMNLLTTPGTVAGAKAYISIDKAESGDIKVCYDAGWEGMPGDPACPASTPLPIGCASDMEFEIVFFGTQYIWKMFDGATVLASLHFDKAKNPDVASIQVFLNDPTCNVLYNAFSCPK